MKNDEIQRFERRYQTFPASMGGNFYGGPGSQTFSACKKNEFSPAKMRHILLDFTSKKCLM